MRTWIFEENTDRFVDVKDRFVYKNGSLGNFYGCIHNLKLTEYASNPLTPIREVGLSAKLIINGLKEEPPEDEPIMKIAYRMAQAIQKSIAIMEEKE